MLLFLQLCQRLLQQGKDVRILVRKNSPSEELAKQGRANTAQSLTQAGAQAVYGDLKDRASLDHPAPPGQRARKRNQRD